MKLQYMLDTNLVLWVDFRVGGHSWACLAPESVLSWERRSVAERASHFMICLTSERLWQHEDNPVVKRTYGRLVNLDDMQVCFHKCWLDMSNN